MGSIPDSYGISLTAVRRLGPMTCARKRITSDITMEIATKMKIGSAGMLFRVYKVSQPTAHFQAEPREARIIAVRSKCETDRRAGFRACQNSERRIPGKSHDAASESLR